MKPRSTAVVSILLLALTLPRTFAEDPYWVAPMKKVHAKFTGKEGTFAHFGDSITITMAFWSSMKWAHKNMDAETAKAFELAKGHMLDECWNRWKGPSFGNQGTMTVRWAHANVDRWLKSLNPEAALIMFGTNDLTSVPIQDYEAKTREVVQKCLDNGTVVILSTIPPRHGMLEKSKQYAEVVRKIAKELRVPLCDYMAAILERRPDDWDGAMDKFKDRKGYQVLTLVAGDGVHPSNPKEFNGDYSEEGLKTSGFVLRNYVSLLSYAEVVTNVLASAGAAQTPAGAQPPAGEQPPPTGPKGPKPAPKGETVRLKATADVWLSDAIESERNSSAGKASRFKIKTIQEMAAIRFDATPAAGREVLKAALHLRRAGKDQLRYIRVSTVNQDWEEGTGTGAYGPGNGATYMFADHATKRPWAWPGSQFCDVIMTSGNSLATWAERKELADGWVSVELTPELIYALVAKDTDGLAVMDGGNLAYFNNFMHSSESRGSEPYIEATLGEPLAAAPEKPEVKAEPAPERSHLNSGAIKITIEEAENVFCWRLKLDGKPVERWRVKHPASEGETVMYLEDLPASQGLALEVIAVSPGGKASAPAAVTVTTSPALSQELDLGKFVPPPSGSSAPMQAGKLKVWAFPGNVKVSPERPNALFNDMGAAGDPRESNAVWNGKQIRVFGAKGEYVSYQICVEKLGADALKGIRLLPGELKGPDGASIGGSEIELYKNWYARNQKGRWQPAFCVPLKAGAASEIPDPKRNLAGQQNQSFYVDVYVPKDATPGDYAGQLTVEADGARPISLPVQLKVFDFVLPDRLSFWAELNAYRVPPDSHDYYRLAHQHRLVANFWRYRPRLEGSGKGIKVLWDDYDRAAGPLLSGEAFVQNRRAGIPVPCMYLPFEDSWPTALTKETYNYQGHWPGRGDDKKHINEHYLKAPYIGDGLSQSYKDAFLSVERQFIEHFKQKGWDQTEMQCFYGGKNTHRTQWGVNMWWTTDEPYHWDDWLALQFFCRLWAKGRGDAPWDRWVARADISRPNWQGRVLEGGVDTVYFGGFSHARSYQRCRLMKQDTGLKIMTYGSANADSTSNTSSVSLLLNMWSNGSNGHLPWQTLGADGALDNGDPRGGGNALMVPGKRFGLKVVGDMRLKALRDGEQIIEYLRILMERHKLQREQVKALVYKAVHIEAGRQAGASLDNADALRFGSLKAWQIAELRRRVAALILGKEPSAWEQEGGGARGQSPEARSQRPDVRGQRTEDRGRKAEGKRGEGQATRVAKGPKIDGTLKDPVWQKSSLFVLGDVTGPMEAELKTTARILNDDRTLYVGFECEEPQTDSLKSEAKPDGAVWSDDCVEVFISADPEIGYRHLGINPAGTIYDQDCRADGSKNEAWNCTAVVKTAVERNKRWTAALAIPLKELDAYVGEDVEWRLNMTRCRPARGGSPYLEYSWSVLPSTSFHQPAAFGRLSGVTIPERADGVTRKRKAAAKTPAVKIDVGVQAGDVTVYYKFDFDQDPGGLACPAHVQVRNVPGASGGEAVRFSRKGPGPGFGASLSVNIPKSTDLRVAYHARASGMPRACLNVYDKVARDNTTSSAYRVLSDEVWSPVVYFLDGFRYNSQRIGTRVKADTFYQEIRFHGEQAGSKDTWMELDNFVVYRGEDRTPPSRVEGVKAAGKDGTVTLTWEPATDNAAVMLYVVSRSVEGEPFQKVGESYLPSFTDSAAADAEHRYRVLACDFEGNLGEWSAPASVAAEVNLDQRLEPPVEVQERNGYRERVLEIAAKGVGKVNRGVVLCYGDSLTGATGYPLEVQSALGTKRVVGYGYPSQKTSFGRANAVSNLGRANPYLALILFGTNNSKSAAAIEKAMQDLEAIVEIAAERGIIPVLGTIPPRGFNDPDSKPEAAYNNALIETCKRLRVPCGHLFEDYQSQRDRRKLIAGDGVHNTREGMVTSARAWRRVVDQVHFVLRDRP